ncbi:pyridoxamine 5'-phosphate oxidase family protein [Paenibacillus sp. FJAT-26967]|uniref:pyridoxamine 5'-phosphate oxidase family protein n=1 Tax=Paenibacillus sp. FJAT-26967 TaxID=1729690 RepID=UPI000837B404|nr:pyridoxamine 5'-phosphate oxidase family protein [Paenibacillus sp. FJAT-26967]
MTHERENRIQSEEELRELLGYPNPIVSSMTIHKLDPYCRNYISQSPLLFISTSDADGNCDVSPRGDAAGFVHIVDDHNLVIPERPGNRRMNSYRNILSNPHVGLIFLIPGLEETLRMNGEAYLTRDPRLLKVMEAQGKIPKLAIGVKIQECFVHCAKAFKRSKLWEPDSWPASLPSIPDMIAAHVNKEDVTAEDVAGALKESYERRMY